MHVGPPIEGGSVAPLPPKTEKKAGGGDAKKADEGKEGKKAGEEMTSVPSTVLVLHVPEDAKVYLSGKLTRTPGATREYTTQILRRGRMLSTYPIRVEVERGGVTVVKNETIALRGGQFHELTIEVSPTDIARARAARTR